MKIRFLQRTVVATAAFLLLGPAHAEAHLVSTGFGPFYDGMNHVAFSPEFWVPVVALALFAGLRGKETGQKVIFIHPAAWLIGGIAGTLLPVSPASSLTACFILMLGLLVAADLRISSNPVAIVAAVLGLELGWMHGAAMQLTGGGKWPAVIGAAVPIFLLLTIIAAFVVSLKQPWTRIGVRTMGSWIAATGLLLIGWCLRPERF